MNIRVRVFMWTHVSISLRHIRSSGIARLYGRKKASQVALLEKNLSANAGDIRDIGSIPGLGKELSGHVGSSSNGVS